MTTAVFVGALLYVKCDLFTDESCSFDADELSTQYPKLLEADASEDLKFKLDDDFRTHTLWEVGRLERQLQLAMRCTNAAHARSTLLSVRFGESGRVTMPKRIQCVAS
jgi:thymidylate synthase ThyX